MAVETPGPQAASPPASGSPPGTAAGGRARQTSPRGGYLARTRAVSAATYGVLLALSGIFILPFLWMLSASLKTDASVHEYPPTLIPRETVRRAYEGRMLRVADYRPPEGGPAREALVLDEREGEYVLLFPGPGEAREEVAAPRSSVTIRRVVRPRWENYREAWTAKPFGRFVLNSIIITLSCILGQVLSASLVAFGFARLRFPGRGPLFLLVLSTLMLPSQVTMMPHYLLYRSLGWIDTFLPLIVPSFLGGGAFYIFLFRQFFMTLPRELDESARLDGASSFRVYWNVLMPLSRPIVTTIAVFSFIAHWNEFMGPLIYLNSPEKMTLALGLRVFQDAYITYLHLLMAAATVALLPVLVIFFFAQKQFIRSIVLTGLKG